MLRILGNPKRLCDGLTRRDLLQVGGAGILGLSLDRLAGSQVRQERFAARSTGPATRHCGRSFGRAKHCILLFLVRIAEPA